jgi:hypothetical protein
MLTRIYSKNHTFLVKRYYFFDLIQLNVMNDSETLIPKWFLKCWVEYAFQCDFIHSIHCSIYPELVAPDSFMLIWYASTICFLLVFALLSKYYPLLHFIFLYLLFKQVVIVEKISKWQRQTWLHTMNFLHILERSHSSVEV